jgi:hypothetical protein
MSSSLVPRLASLLAALAVAGPALAQYPPPPPGAPPPPQPGVTLQQAPQKKTHLSAFTGWQVNGDISGYSGKLQIDDSQNFGAAISTDVGPGAQIQLIWLYNDTTARYNSYDPIYPSTQEFDVQQHYFQIGGTKGFRRDKIETFFGGTLGAALFIPGTVKTQTGGVNIDAGDTWRFAMTLGGGFNVFFNPKLALRFDARMLLPMYFNGGSVYVGTGGSGLAVSAGIPSVQGSFTAGLTFVP